jgi:hypothetical protein
VDALMKKLLEWTHISYQLLKARGNSQKALFSQL